MAHMDKIHNGILRKFHTLCTLNGLSADEKAAIVNSYGVESSADIDTHDLINICAKLSGDADGGKGNYVHPIKKRNTGGVADHMRVAGEAANWLKLHPDGAVSTDTIGEGAVFENYLRR